MLELVTALLLAFVSVNGIHVHIGVGLEIPKAAAAAPKIKARAAPPAQWCYYGALNKVGAPPVYLRCPPGHGVKQVPSSR